jgi:uncharacterized repeat protein (TIGR01451 family)
MKKKLTNSSFFVGSMLAGLILAGCAQQQQSGRYRPEPGPSKASEPAPAKAAEPASARDFGPSYATVQEGGLRYIRGSMAFPTGRRESSGLLVEKTVPAEALAGQKVEYVYKVSNLTDYPIQMVTLMDRVSGSFTPGDADPKPTDMSGGVATWQLGNLGPKETKVVRVRGTAKDEGAITTCGWATYSPILCEDIRVVKANIALTKTAPAEVTVCDPIPMTLVVKNTGSSGLTGVKVTDTLPEGLVSDGKRSLTFDAGNLAPGATREFKFNAAATKPGRYVNNAKATSAEGISADASSTTTVREPVLAVTCQAPDQRYMGRNFDVCFTVVNKGDVAAAGTMLQVPIPAGLTFKSATAGGRVSGNNLVWDLGALPANAPKEVCATFAAANAGNFQFNATAKGACAKEVSTTCATRIVGVSALLLECVDDPDPISVGENTTYTIRVTNQGTADDTNIRIVVEFPAEITPTSASNGGKVEGKRVTFPVYPRLAPKAAFTYTIQAKGEKTGDARISVVRTSTDIPAPTTEEESTRVY